MSITKRTLMLLFSVVLFFLLWRLYTPNQSAWHSASEWSKALPEVRSGVLQTLESLQEGYTQRDSRRLDTFMNRVFSREHPVVLGTVPGEIFIGYGEVTKLVQDDWQGWGDCRFRLQETEVSGSGDVAWFATVGSVKFDLSRLLVVPLRLTGVMVNENGVWKIRQAQFQFDLDVSRLLLGQIVAAIWVAVNFVLLAVTVFRRKRGSAPMQSQVAAGE